jgi:hypothetical protein
LEAPRQERRAQRTITCGRRGCEEPHEQPHGGFAYCPKHEAEDQPHRPVRACHASRPIWNRFCACGRRIKADHDACWECRQKKAPRLCSCGNAIGRKTYDKCFSCRDREAKGHGGTSGRKRATYGRYCECGRGIRDVAREQCSQCVRRSVAAP